MTHAIPYVVLGLAGFAALAGLDKMVAEIVKAIIYLAMGLRLCAAHSSNRRVSRFIGVLGLIVAFTVVDVSRVPPDEPRPAIMRAVAVLPQPVRVGG